MKRLGLLKNTARFLGAAALCWWILRAVPLGEAVSRLASASLPLLALSLATTFGVLYVQDVRCKILLLGKGPSVWKLFLWNLVGGAASFVLPSSASGDVVKALLMGKEEGVMGRSVMTTLLGRYLGLFSTLAICVVGFLLWPAAREAISLPKLLAVVLVLVALAAAGVVALRLLHRRRRGAVSDGKWSRRFDSALEVFHEATMHPKAVAQAFVLSIVLQVGNLFAGWLLFRAIGDGIGFSPVLALMPLVQLGTIAPLTVGGVGVREGLTLGLFHGLAGVARENCLAANLAGYVVSAGMALTGLVAWFLLRSGRKSSAPGTQAPTA